MDSFFSPPDRDHGPTVTDHTEEREHWSGYWEHRTKSIEAQHIHSVYGNAAETLGKRGRSGATTSAAETEKDRKVAAMKRFKRDAPTTVTEQKSDKAREQAVDADCKTSDTKATSPVNAEDTEQKATPLFQGVVVWFNGLTGNISALHLGRMIRLHGGRTLPMPSSAVTHVVCSNLNGSKTDRALKRIGGAKKRYVSATWITDSIAASRKLNEEPYLIVRTSGQTMTDFFGRT